MPMAAPQRIQAFPAGMIVPAEAAPSVAAPAPRLDGLADIERRRRELIARLAALGTHSHRRAELTGRLRELTARQLRMEADLLRAQRGRP
jgi:hypothetical protein